MRNNGRIGKLRRRKTALVITLHWLEHYVQRIEKNPLDRNALWQVGEKRQIISTLKERIELP